MTDNASKPDVTAASSPSLPGNDPSVTGYDPGARWRNYFNILTNRMTLEGREAFREDAYVRNEARDCARCEDWREFLFKYSPIIRFMSGNITALNGKLDADNVRCQRCVTRTITVQEKDEDGVVREVEKKIRQGGGFSPGHGILICANEMRNQGHMEDTLAHEMVHAWDHLRFKVDWADLRHAACTEVGPDSFLPWRYAKR
jgi:mitochondrial inner membrane protease ATP23